MRQKSVLEKEPATLVVKKTGHGIQLYDRLNKVIHAMSAYLTAILDDTTQNVPCDFDLRQFDAVLPDLPLTWPAPSDMPPRNDARRVGMALQSNIKPSDRLGFNGGSDARTIMGRAEFHLRLGLLAEYRTD